MKLKWIIFRFFVYRVLCIIWIIIRWSSWRFDCGTIFWIRAFDWFQTVFFGFMFRFMDRVSVIRSSYRICGFFVVWYDFISWILGRLVVRWSWNDLWRSFVGLRFIRSCCCCLNCCCFIFIPYPLIPIPWNAIIIRSLSSLVICFV